MVTITEKQLPIRRYFSSLAMNMCSYVIPYLSKGINNNKVRTPMTLPSRLITNLLLPLLFLRCGYLLFYHLGDGLMEEIILQVLATGLALLVAALPPIVFSFLIRSQIQEGFALLKSGKVVTPGEITLPDVIGYQIMAWKPFKQRLDTEICLQYNGDILYVQLGLDYYIPPNERGKDFVRNFKTNIAVFEAWVQRSIFRASQLDPELLHSLHEECLLNEADEQRLRRKFLSALESRLLLGVKLPTTPNGLRINRQVRKKQSLPSAQSSLLADDQCREADTLTSP